MKPQFRSPKECRFCPCRHYVTLVSSKLDYGCLDLILHNIDALKTWVVHNAQLLLLLLLRWRSCTPIRATLHTSQGLWPCKCQGPWHSSQRRTNCLTYMVCHGIKRNLWWTSKATFDVRSEARLSNLRQAYLLEVGMTQDSDKPCRNPWRLFIHDNSLETLGLHLLVWSELGRSCSFQPMRDLKMQHATSHTRLRAHDHCTSNTLVGGKGKANPSSLHTTLEGPT